MVTMDEEGYVNIWGYKAHSFSGFDWIIPTSRYLVDVTEKQFFPNDQVQQRHLFPPAGLPEDVAQESSKQYFKSVMKSLEKGLLPYRQYILLARFKFIHFDDRNLSSAILNLSECRWDPDPIPYGDKYEATRWHGRDTSGPLDAFVPT